jgi:endonuclease YncB( thermonuclease family)
VALAVDSELVLAVSWGAGGRLVLAAGPGRAVWRMVRRRARPEHRAAPRLVFEAPKPRPRVPEPFSGKAWVVDGDTIRVGQVRVRLFGMDAPEMSQAGGSKAKSHMIRLAGGKPVSVQPVTVDCYGRVVARVACGGVDLSERMVVDGFARAMTDWHLDYAAAEIRARQERRGLWARDAATGIGDPAAHRRAEAAARRG